MNKTLSFIAVLFLICSPQPGYAIPPTVSTDPAAAIFASKSALNGTINPNGLTTTYYFEYGETDSYGYNTEVGNLNNVSIDIEVTEDLAGLESSTIYHYRLVAVNADGTTYGEDSTFATKPAYIVDAFPSPHSEPTGLTFDGEYFWVVDDWPSWAYQRIYQIDSGGNEISSFQTEAGESTVGGIPQGLHYDGTYLWLADPRNDRFIQYNTLGDEIDAINSPAQFPTGLTFDGVYFWNADSNADEIFQLDTSGNPVTSFYSPGENPKGLEFDGTHLWIADSDADRIYKMDTSGNVIETLLSPGSYPSGLAFDGTFLWNSDYLDGQIYQLDPTLIPASTPPLVTTDSAASITSVAAQLNGTLNPNGLDTSYYFEYGTSTAYGESTTGTDVGDGTNNVDAVKNLTTLMPDTTYHFRLVAENSDGLVQGADRTFTTLDILDPPELSVTPVEGFQASGFPGGPFTPASKTYTLSNIGQVALDWTASKSQHWFDLSSQAGTLSPGETTTVDMSINDLANSLSLNTYTDAVVFSNTTNGNGSTGRAVILSVTKTSTIITCSPFSNETTVGLPATVSGEIIPPPSSAGAGVDIILTSPSDIEIHVNAQANALGEFSEVLPCYIVNEAGTWSIQTSWSGDNEHFGAASAIKNLIVEKAGSRVTIDSTSQAIKMSDPIDISGKFTPEPDCTGSDLSGLAIELELIDPDGIDTTHTIFTNDPYGHYVLQDFSGFNKLGQWTLTAKFTGNASFLSSQSNVILIQVLETSGYAIIVQGKIADEEGIASHNKTTNFVYNKLKDRGLFDEDIKYFNYDTGQAGVDDIPNKSAIGSAVTTWAAAKMNDVPANLYLILVDHGLDDVFYISPDSISSTELSGWLGTLQATLTGQADEQEIIVILGFCRSGSFIDNLSGTNRVIITSAAAGESSYKGPLDEDGVREGEYFISEFFKEVTFGKSVAACFQNATVLTEKFTSSEAVLSNNAPFFDDSLQHPLLDDNGDGMGSNDLTDPESDGAASMELYIGVSSVTGNDPGDVGIIDVAETIFLGTDEEITTLWAKVDNSNRLRTIWTEIKPPGYTPTETGDTGQGEFELLKSVYNHSAGDDVYEWIDLGGFADPGTYQIFYFAKDDLTENISPLKESKVYKAKFSNTAPNPFSLVSPSDGEEVLTTAILDWQDTADSDGDKFTFALLLSSGDNLFSDPIRIEALSYSSYLISPDDGITDLTTYYWKVQAIDEYGAIIESDTRIFTTNNTNPLTGWVKGLVYDQTTGYSINDAIVSIGDADIHSSLGGYYLGAVQPGTYAITVTASGFYGANQPIDIPEGSIVTKNFGLLPAGESLSAIIQSPNTDVTVNEGQAVNFQGSALGGAPPYSYLWDFDGGAADSTQEDPGNVVFTAEGTYTVTLTVTDDEGDLSYDSVVIMVDAVDLCPEDPDKTDPGICGCGVADTDTDGDDWPDCIDLWPDDSSEWADNDEDGIGDNADLDDDDDGMPDAWEETYGLDPLVDDAFEDVDQDGFTNFEEYLLGSDPTNRNDPRMRTMPWIPLLLL